MGNRWYNLFSALYKRYPWIRFLVGGGFLWLCCSQSLALDRTIAPTADLGGDLGATNRRWRAVYTQTPTADDAAATKAYVDAQVATPVTNTAIYANLYIADGLSTNTITPADTYVQITGWTTGEYANVSLSTSNITILADGTYVISQAISFSDGNNNTIDSAFFVNDVEQDPGKFRRKLGTGGDVGSAAGSAVFTLNSTDVVDLRMLVVGSTGDVIIEQGQLYLSVVSTVTAGTNWSQYPAQGTVDMDLQKLDDVNVLDVQGSIQNEVSGIVSVNATALNVLGYIYDSGGNLILNDAVDVVGILDARSTIINSTGTLTLNDAAAVTGVFDVQNDLKLTGANVLDGSSHSIISIAGTTTGGNLVISIGDNEAEANETRIILSDNAQTITIYGTINVSGDISGDILYGKTPVLTTATNRTWTSAEAENLLVCITANTKTQTLSGVISGDMITFQSLGTDYVIQVEIDASDFITMDGLQGAADEGIVSSGLPGDQVTLVGQNTTNWVVVGKSGIWTQTTPP